MTFERDTEERQQHPPLKTFQPILPPIWLFECHSLCSAETRRYLVQVVKVVGCACHHFVQAPASRWIISLSSQASPVDIHRLQIPSTSHPLSLSETAHCVAHSIPHFCRMHSLVDSRLSRILLLGLEDLPPTWGIALRMQRQLL